jgi:hypothetical protein
MSSQCDTGPLKKDIPAAMIAMIAATIMSAVNPCGHAAALEVTDDRTECEARWFACTYERKEIQNSTPPCVSRSGYHRFTLLGLLVSFPPR